MKKLKRQVKHTNSPSKVQGGGFQLAVALGAAFLLALAAAKGANYVWENFCFNGKWGACEVKSPVPAGWESLTRPAVVFAAGSSESEPEKRPPKISELVETYAEKYAHGDYEKYRLIYRLHCLLWHESNYYLNKANGDNGRAGGALQYHDGTWQAFRKEMMRQGLVAEVGSRYDLEQAIETTAWALAHGKANNWGPIVRGQCR